MLRYEYLMVGLLALAAYIALIALFIKFNKKTKIIDAVLIWPLLLRGQRSRREGRFILFGIFVVLILIVAAQFIKS